MYPDLHLVTYRQHEHELVERLERRRIAQERAATAAPMGTVAAAVAPARLAWTRRTAAVGGAVSRLAGRVARGRQAAGAATTPTACCSPA